MTEPIDDLLGQWPKNEEQIQRFYQRYMALEGDEMAFETQRTLDAIGREGLGRTYSMEAMAFMKDNINMFINTRLMRKWEETGYAPQKVTVLVHVQLDTQYPHRKEGPMRVVKVFSATLNPEADCQDCDWEWPIGERTLTEVRIHVKATNHKVIVTSRTIARYEQR
jgi:hypothetical protein